MAIGVKGAGRRGFAGWCMGLGFSMFFSQAVLIITRLFGAMQTVARPAQGYIYTLTDHAQVFFVSAGLALINRTIFVFWLVIVVGMLVAPKQPKVAGRRRAIDDPDGAVKRWAFIGVATAVVLRLCATPLADGLIRLGWLRL